MRVKAEFLSETHIPSAVIEIKFLPRVGEIVHLGENRRMQVVEVLPTVNDKRYSAVIRGKPFR